MPVLPYACLGPTYEEVRRAEVLAYANDSTERLPEGFMTQVDLHRMRLFSGPRQRIGLDTPIKDAPTLLLDEPTSVIGRGIEEHVIAPLELPASFHPFSDDLGSALGSTGRRGARGF
jgi:ABC-type bacteriocin/lantibiotic exporter with double-glycine peptidase domain